MNRNYHIFYLSLFLISTLFTTSCQSEKEQAIMERITMDNITIPKGFEIEVLYKPGIHDQGSWVSVTKDDQGRLYSSDQYGNIYKIILPDEMNKLDSVVVSKLDINIGQAQGLLWHDDFLYALVNSDVKKDILIHSGLYKISSSKNNGEFDTVKMLRSFDGQGEHGPHNVILSPDKKSLYLVLGNHTDIPDDLKSTLSKNWDEDNLLPVIKDPSGHANSRKAPGGWVVKTDFEGKEWTIMDVGLRNTYDIAFNRDGELFGFDSDMEYDMGMPWYRPIRLCHFTSGGDFGWRTGTGKFLNSYPDNLPGIANLGQGSPTGVMYGEGLKFPKYYQDGIYLFDWSYGTMYYAKLNPNGSSYDAEITEFLSGVPLPLTNGIAGDDGAFYFLTGGRRLESVLYKLKYTGEMPNQIVNLAENNKGKKERNIRKELEKLHIEKSADKIDFIESYLDNSDRFIRYAARLALENQDYNLWKDLIDGDNSPLKQISISLAIARNGDDATRNNALNSLLEFDWTALTESQKIDYIRAVDLLIIRMGNELSDLQTNNLKKIFLSSYLNSSDVVNKELSKILSYLQASEIITETLLKMETDTVTSNLKSIYLSGNVSGRSEQYGKDVENMLKNMPNQQHISYAKSLSVIKTGWTKDLRERYFLWYNKALKKSGGLMYTKFIKAIQQRALANVPKEERQFFEALGEDLNNNGNYMLDLKQPEGPGQNWAVASLLSNYKNNSSKPNFNNGENMFKASLCASCHSVNGKGGSSGPELTKIGMRFSLNDLAESIINPSSTISDRYGYTNYHLENEKIITGRIFNETDKELELSTNAFSPSLTVKIRKDKIVNEEKSEISPMPSNLINRLNEKELNDLIAYLLSGGNKENKVYK